MKKVALSLLAFALVGGAAFADATADVVKSPVTASLDVNASASLGYDLDTKIHGFSNSVTTNLTLWFLNGSSAKTGEGDIHGYINAADIKLGFDGSKSFNNLTSVDDNIVDADGEVVNTTPAVAFGDVTAKIVAGDLYIKLYTNTDASEGYSRDVDDDNGGSGTSSDGTFVKYAGTYGGDTEWSSTAISGYDAFDSTGVEVGYTIPNVAAFVFEVGSLGDWTAAQQTDYDVSAKVNLLSVEKLTLGAKAYYGKNMSADAVTAFGAEFAYDLGVVAPFFNANYELGAAAYTLDAGAKAPLVDGLNVVAWAQYTSDEVANAQVTLDLAEAKLAGPLSASVGARFYDITATSSAAKSGEVFAKAGLKATDTIKIYGSVDAYSAYNVDTKSIYAKAGCDFTGISLTTISVNWDSSDLGDAKAEADNKLGKVVLTAKVAY